MPEGVNVLDMSGIIGIFGLVVYVLFFVGLVIKIRQGEEKEKILKQLDEQSEAKYSQNEKSSAKENN